MLTLGVSGFAQKNGGGGKAKATKNEPKSTAPVAAHAPKSARSSSKDLQKIEHEKPGKGAHAKKAPAAKVKNAKESRSSGINFNGKGGRGSGVSGRNGGAGSLKGRLKEKGKGKKNQ